MSVSDARVDVLRAAYQISLIADDISEMASMMFDHWLPIATAKIAVDRECSQHDVFEAAREVRGIMSDFIETMSDKSALMTRKVAPCLTNAVDALGEGGS